TKRLPSRGTLTLKFVAARCVSMARARPATGPRQKHGCNRRRRIRAAPGNAPERSCANTSKPSLPQKSQLFKVSKPCFWAQNMYNKKYYGGQGAGGSPLRSAGLIV